MDIFEAPYEIAEVESTLVDVYEPFVNIPNGYSRARHYTTSFTKTDTLALLTDTIDVYLRFIDEEKKPYDSLHVQMTLDQLRENPPIEGVTSTGEKRRIHASYLKVVKRDEEITVRIEGLMFVKWCLGSYELWAVAILSGVKDDNKNYAFPIFNYTVNLPL